MSDAAAPSKERWLESLTWQSARGLPSGEVVDEASWRATMGCAPAPNECHITSTTLSQYADLTSVHVNSTDEKLLCSGYSNDVSVYDIETGKRVSHAPVAAQRTPCKAFARQPLPACATRLACGSGKPVTTK
ncbi:unnamed protein product, partial [Symbiodinium sp. KB8]